MAVIFVRHLLECLLTLYAIFRLLAVHPDIFTVAVLPVLCHARNQLTNFPVVTTNQFPLASMFHFLDDKTTTLVFSVGCRPSALTFVTPSPPSSISLFQKIWL